jgi:HK97 family phage portal protein
MNIFDFFKRKAPSQQPGRLPFVQLFGYEKSYGATQPQDYNRQVAAYKSWVFACAQKNAFSVAKCNLKLYKDGPDPKVIDKHPFLDLLKNVNPNQNKFELMTITELFLELTGNAYWWMPRDTLRTPGMIWNIPANWMSIVPSRENFIDGYVMKVPGLGKPVPFAEDEIVHFKFPSPFDLYYGTGPTFAAAYAIDLNDNIKTWGINFFMNNAQPSGVLTTDDSLSPDQYARLRDEWNRKHKGSSNAGKMAILEAGLKYQQTGSTLKDARFEDISREVRDEILASFGVPASKLGLVEDVNRANADANDYTYQKETIIPRLTLIEEKLNEKVMPMYDSGLIVKFDSPVPEDKAFRLQQITSHLASGYSSIDEEREKDGEEPYNLPETELPLIGMGLTPAGTPKPDPVEPTDQNQDPDTKKQLLTKAVEHKKWHNFIAVSTPQERALGEYMKRYFQSQHSEVMRNIATYRKSAEKIDKSSLTHIVFNSKEQIEKLKVASEQYVRNALVSGVMLGGAEVGIDINLKLREPFLLHRIKNRINFFAEKTNETTYSLINSEMDASVQAGETYEDLVRRVDKVFQFSEDFRSTRIGTTEIIGAINDGLIESYRIAGYEGKMWMTAGDERVRDSHAALEGSTELLDETFKTINGNTLLYPGDRMSCDDPAEIINCRCTLIGVKNL